MSRTPVEIANRIRAQRRFLQRIVRVTFPITAIGVAIIFAAGTRVSEAAMNVVLVPTVIAFFATWFSLVALWALGFRDLRNMLRPGSAEAYGKGRK